MDESRPEQKNLSFGDVQCSDIKVSVENSPSPPRNTDGPSSDEAQQIAKMFSFGDISCSEVQVSIKNRPSSSPHTPSTTGRDRSCTGISCSDSSVPRLFVMDFAEEEIVGVGGTAIRVAQRAALSKADRKGLISQLTNSAMALRSLLNDYPPNPKDSHISVRDLSSFGRYKPHLKELYIEADGLLGDLGVEIAAKKKDMEDLVDKGANWKVVLFEDSKYIQKLCKKYNTLKTDTNPQTRDALLKAVIAYESRSWSTNQLKEVIARARELSQRIEGCLNKIPGRRRSMGSDDDRGDEGSSHSARKTRKIAPVKLRERPGSEESQDEPEESQDEPEAEPPAKKVSSKKSNFGRVSSKGNLKVKNTSSTSVQSVSQVQTRREPKSTTPQGSVVLSNGVTIE